MDKPDESERFTKFADGMANRQFWDVRGILNYIRVRDEFIKTFVAVMREVYLEAGYQLPERSTKTYTKDELKIYIEQNISDVIERKIALLRFVDELKLSEIATKTSHRLGTIKNTCSKLMKNHEILRSQKRLTGKKKNTG